MKAQAKSSDQFDGGHYHRRRKRHGFPLTDSPFSLHRRRKRHGRESRVRRSRWPRLASSSFTAHKPSSSPTSKTRRAIVIVVIIAL
nr:hypothetical protein CFP56_75487 [Quercus suber]